MAQLHQSFDGTQCSGSEYFERSSGTYRCGICDAVLPPPVKKSAEQQARDLLERMEVEGAQAYSAGELIELADFIADANAYRRLKASTPSV